MAAKKQFLLRISRPLWEEIERMAADELRSVNAQIEYLLREAVLRRRRGALRSDREADGSAPSDTGTEVPTADREF